MTVERATGLVVRTRLLTDTSLIIHWLTPDLGRVATVAKGARRLKSPFRGKLDLFYLGDFSFHRSRRSELHTLREVVLLETHPALREDLARLRQAAYGALLVERLTETDTPLLEVYRLFKGLLDLLQAQPAQPFPLLAFELKLLAELGSPPNLAASSLTAGVKQAIEYSLAADWPSLTRLKLTLAQAAELDHFVRGLLISNLGDVPRGRREALAPASA
jgi:DNA repair protein RecO (recombination protein O)